jgi:hypothetical protein
LACQRLCHPPDNFGVVFQSRFDFRGGLVLHNHPIDVDVPGSRLLWISERGQQLVLEPLDVLLDSIDRAAPAGKGWTPECGLVMEGETLQKADVHEEAGGNAELATEPASESDTAVAYETCA